MAKGIGDLLNDWRECLSGVGESTCRVEEALNGPTVEDLLDRVRERGLGLARAQSLAEELKALIEAHPLSQWDADLICELGEVRSLVGSLLSSGDRVLKAVQARRQETERGLKALRQAKRILKSYFPRAGKEGYLVDLREPKG